MKKQKTWVSWTWLALAFTIFVGAIFAAFVPIHTNKGDYRSFFGAIKYSTTLSDTIKVTYNYKSPDGVTNPNVKSACKQIESVLSKNGFVSATATQVGSNKITVTLAKPNNSTDLQSAMALLGSNGIGTGGFEIKVENKSTAESIIVGSKHVKKVSILSNSGYYYTVVEFTEEGKQLLSVAESSGSSVKYYLFFGGSSSITGGYAFTQDNNFVDGNLYIGGFADESTAEQYQLMCQMGSLPVELQSASVRDINYINTSSNTTRIVMWSFVLAVIVAFTIAIAVRHGVYAFVAALTTNGLIATTTLLLMAIMPWVEVGVSTLAIIAISLSIANFGILAMFERMRNQHLGGKDTELSIDVGYTKSLLPTILTALIAFVLGLFTAVAFTGAVQAMGTVVAIISLLSGALIPSATYGIFACQYRVGKTNRHTLAWEAHKHENN